MPQQLPRQSLGPLLHRPQQLPRQSLGLLEREDFIQLGETTVDSSVDDSTGLQGGASGGCCGCLDFAFCQFPWCTIIFATLSAVAIFIMIPEFGKIKDALKQVPIQACQSYPGAVHTYLWVTAFVTLGINVALSIFGILTSKLCMERCKKVNACDFCLRCFTTTISFILYLVCVLFVILSVVALCVVCACVPIAFIVREVAVKDYINQYQQLMAIYKNFQTQLGQLQNGIQLPNINAEMLKAIHEAGKRISSRTLFWVTICMVAFVLAQIAMTISARDNYLLSREADVEDKPSYDEAMPGRL